MGSGEGGGGGGEEGAKQNILLVGNEQDNFLFGNQVSDSPSLFLYLSLSLSLPLPLPLPPPLSLSLSPPPSLSPFWDVADEIEKLWKLCSSAQKGLCGYSVGLLCFTDAVAATHCSFVRSFIHSSIHSFIYSVSKDVFTIQFEDFLMYVMAASIGFWECFWKVVTWFIHDRPDKHCCCHAFITSLASCSPPVASLINNLPTCLSACLSAIGCYLVCLPAHLSVGMSVCHRVLPCLPTCPSVCRHVCLP